MEDGRRSHGPASAEEAHSRALRLLARRPLSEAELRAALERAGDPRQQIENTVERLRGAGYLDDRRLAEQVVREHARRGHAPQRARTALLGRGVAAEDIRAAEESFDRERPEVRRPDLAERVREMVSAERRPVDRRALRRVYNRLLRAGFDESEVLAALEPFLPTERDGQRADAAGDAMPRARRTTGYDDECT